MPAIFFGLLLLSAAGGVFYAMRQGKVAHTNEALSAESGGARPLKGLTDMALLRAIMLGDAPSTPAESYAELAHLAEVYNLITGPGTTADSYGVDPEFTAWVNKQVFVNTAAMLSPSAGGSVEALTKMRMSARTTPDEIKAGDFLRVLFREVQIRAFDRGGLDPEVH